MKALRSILILCVALCFATSCRKGVDMTIIQTTYFENADIRHIEIGDAWTVGIVADSSAFVEVEHSAYLAPYLKIRMEGTKLEVGFTGRVYAETGSVFRATIHTNHVETIEIGDAANVRCDGGFSGQDLELKMSGASQCSHLVFSGEGCRIDMDDASVCSGFRFIGSHCKAVLEGASQFNGQIDAGDHIDIELDDASRFVAKGDATTSANIKLLNASLLNMAETEIGTMEAELSGASEATVRVGTLLSGTLTEASTLYYKGHPQTNVACSDDSRLIPF